MTGKGYIPHVFRNEDTEDADEHRDALERLRVEKCEREGRDPYPMSERDKKWDEEDARIDAHEKASKP